MKGTIDALIPNAEEILMNDQKEKAEHFTICDLIRNDLNSVSKNVRIEKFRYCDKINTANGAILQTSSKISGELDYQPEYNYLESHYNFKGKLNKEREKINTVKRFSYREKLGDIICELLPAGSISGAPKKASVELIHKAEQMDRGYYTGVFGYFDGKELESAVMIRFISEESNEKYYYSGGGITINSKADDEYKEVIEKVYLPKPLEFIETLMIKDGIFQNPQAHIDRIKNTLKVSNINSSIESFDELFNFIHDSKIKYKGIYKCTIKYSFQPIDIKIRPYTCTQINNFIPVICNEIDYSLKYSDRSLLDKLKNENLPIEESLKHNSEIIIIKNGKVTDCSIGNLVFGDGKDYYTPNTFLLNGTMRQRLLKEGKIKEKEITLNDLHLYKKIFIINCMRGIN